jgi:hypothetical protein
MGLPMAMGVYHEKIAFNVVEIVTYNIVLSIPWLKKHDPLIQ